MRKIFFILILLAFGLVASSQTYIGTLTVGNYTQENVEVKLTKAPNGSVTATLYHVKFARMMPVRLDVSIPSLTYSGTQLQGDIIIPTAKGKKYEKYLVRKLAGTVDVQRIAFGCHMGKKMLTYEGTRKND